jgi:hypothetical protein
MSTSGFPAAHNDGSGGFLQPMLPSPAPSTAYSASTVTPSTLPQQRSHPLRAGSSKETTLINYIDQKILFVNRRHAKKFCSAIGGQDEPQTERGYESFREVVKDLESIIDVVWVSGTRMFSCLFIEHYDCVDLILHFTKKLLSRFPI